MSWDRLAATLARRAAALVERRRAHPLGDPQRWRDPRWLWPDLTEKEG
ncbi:hypothetical protein [Qipengyuania sp. 483]